MKAGIKVKGSRPAGGLLTAVLVLFMCFPMTAAAATRITLTGTILPPGHAEGRNVYRLDEWGGQERLFQIDNANEASPQTAERVR